jgi:hypothetical protein
MLVSHIFPKIDPGGPKDLPVSRRHAIWVAKKNP